MKEIGPNIFAMDNLLTEDGSKLTNAKYTTRIISAISSLRGMMQIDESIKIIFKKLGRERAHGQFLLNEKTIEIDPRKYHVRSIISTLCHEMIHAEQEYLGKFWSRQLNERVSLFYWKQNDIITEFHSRKMLKSMKYNELPWEKEAYEREPVILNSILQS